MFTFVTICPFENTMVYNFNCGKIMSLYGQ